MPAATATAWRPAPDAKGLVLRIRLTPKSSVDAIEGCLETPDGVALSARVRAAPEGGKANAALCVVVADWLDLPKRSVTVTSGHKSRIKQLTLHGEAAELTARLKEALAGLRPRRPET
jgi:uncharacterized protein YggU (UPF0235/DUF167 family)